MDIRTVRMPDPEYVLRYYIHRGILTFWCLRHPDTAMEKEIFREKVPEEYLDQVLELTKSGKRFQPSVRFDEKNRGKLAGEIRRTGAKGRRGY